MDIQYRWPEEKLYLFGRLLFAPQDLEDEALTQKAMSHYFPYDDSAKFETALHEYQQAGYFSVNTLKDGKSIKYVINNVDHQRFRDELSSYIDSIAVPVEDMDKFWNAVTKQYKNDYGYNFTIRWRDLYGDSTRFNYHPMFWEYFFKLALDELIELKGFTYDKTLAGAFRGDELVEIPKDMITFYTRPFAMFAVLDKKVQQKIAKSSRSVKYKAGIIITRNRNLQLYLNEKRHTLWHYKSKTSNTYRVASTHS